MQEQVPTLSPAEVLNQSSILIEAEDYEQCIKYLSESLKTLTSSLGELHESLYKLYYTYGDVLLLQYEKENDEKAQISESLLKSASSSEAEENEAERLTEENLHKLQESGEENSDKSLSNESQAGSESIESRDNDDSEGKDEENKPEQVEGDLQEPKAGKEDFDLDLKLAWENLEICRVIVEKLKDVDYECLFKVQSRLGDLQSYSENFLQACCEYIKASETRKLLQEPGSCKDEASLHYMIGHNFLFVKGKETEAEDHFRQAHKLLSQYISGIDEPELISELKSVLEEIELKIEDASDQRKSLHLIGNIEKPADVFDQPTISDPAEEVKRKEHQKVLQGCDEQSHGFQKSNEGINETIQESNDLKKTI